MHRQSREGRLEQGGNIFNGFSQDLLAEALNIDRELVDKLQRNDPQKGIIVEVQDEFRVITPQTRYGQQQEEEEEEEEERRHPREEEERGERRGGSSNGLEETLYTMKLKHNIRKPDLADDYNPRAGRATSYTLPILNKDQLSMELVSLYPNAFYAPHWNINAHSIVYITRGCGRIQISSESGETVLDGVVVEGRLFVVPQGYAVLKKAGSDGLEWIAFKTNGMARISQVVGHGSALSAFTVDVLAKAFGVSREEASRVKNGRWELSLFSPSRGSGSPSRRGGGQS